MFGYIQMKLILLPVILLALTMHEFAHAYVAYLRGDGTAKAMGRMTLNPIPHIDIFGLIFIIFTFFGWAKPVPINPANFKSPKMDEILISLAGVTANLLQALFFGLIIRFVDLSVFGSYTQTVQILIIYSVAINCGLAIFNLIPIPPLDGSHVLKELLPYKMSTKYVMFFARPMTGIIVIVALMLLLNSGLSVILTTPIYFLVKIFSGVTLSL
ncbi:MAG: site-2 protease family protein [Candidatus Firestonebacteria bacterium]